MKTKAPVSIGQHSVNEQGRKFLGSLSEKALEHQSKDQHKPGDRVVHKQLGMGRVEQHHPDQEHPDKGAAYTVRFPTHDMTLHHADLKPHKPKITKVVSSPSKANVKVKQPKSPPHPALGIIEDMRPHMGKVVAAQEETRHREHKERIAAIKASGGGNAMSANKPAEKKSKGKSMKKSDIAKSALVELAGDLIAIGEKEAAKDLLAASIEPLIKADNSRFLSDLGRALGPMAKARGVAYQHSTGAQGAAYSHSFKFGECEVIHKSHGGNISIDLVRPQVPNPSELRLAKAVQTKIYSYYQDGSLMKGEVINLKDRVRKPAGPAASGEATVIQHPDQHSANPVKIKLNEIDRMRMAVMSAYGKHPKHAEAFEHHISSGGWHAGMGNEHADAHHRAAYAHVNKMGLDNQIVSKLMEPSYDDEIGEEPTKFTPHPADKLLGKKFNPYKPNLRKSEDLEKAVFRRNAPTAKRALGRRRKRVGTWSHGNIRSALSSMMQHYASKEATKT